MTKQFGKKRRASAEIWPIKPLPEQHVVVDIDGGYSREELAAMSMGFVPQSRADKWFIYFEGEWLNFHRAATGSCIFRMHLVPDDDGYRATQLIANREASQYRGTDDAYDVQLVAYLVDHLLLGRFAPFPQLGGISDEDQTRHQQLVMGDTDNSIQLDVLKNGNGGHSSSS